MSESITSITLDLTAIGVEAHDLPIAPKSPRFLSKVRLTRVYLGPLASGTVTLGNIHVIDIDSDEIHRGQRATTYRAKLRLNDESATQVVLKIVKHYVDRAPDAKVFESEASRYENELSAFQGDIVPPCFGFFRSNCNGLWISCLVLQYCGEPMDMDFSEMDKRYQYKTLAKLARIHDLGLYHGDFHEPNVLDHNGEPLIIDFERTKNHDCDRDIMTIGQYRPFQQDFGCIEIYRVIGEMELWRSPYFCIDDRPIERSEVNSAEDIYTKIKFDPASDPCNPIINFVREMVEEIIEEKKEMAEELRQMDEEDRRILEPLMVWPDMYSNFVSR
ncbi:hypothetical protein PLICRDRAFT_57206 [Plicaturopsis crispa FD-325 SS-3]|uniref:Aminoglycoside phosphotransferase domain-containing protein n=1 Tax=Plicaturopsis crispa FD-325 SS-3 TaxID=944288 RepID=A0A0C9SS44_PLICR|nr:hypothetical protein PLICRDRAFT_57206 [Plicaturopsis crispa FD-325 SS-3]